MATQETSAQGHAGGRGTSPYHPSSHTPPLESRHAFNTTSILPSREEPSNPRWPLPGLLQEAQILHRHRISGSGPSTKPPTRTSSPMARVPLRHTVRNRHTQPHLLLPKMPTPRTTSTPSRPQDSPQEGNHSPRNPDRDRRNRTHPHRARPHRSTMGLLPMRRHTLSPRTRLQHAPTPLLPMQIQLHTAPPPRRHPRCRDPYGHVPNLTATPSHAPPDAPPTPPPGHAPSTPNGVHGTRGDTTTSTSRPLLPRSHASPGAPAAIRPVHRWSNEGTS